VWPPPESNQNDYYPRPGGSRPQARDYPQYYRHDPFDDPFLSLPHHQFASFAFTDPFTLFNSVFPEFFPRPSRYTHHHRSAPSFFENDPFVQMHNVMHAMMADSMFPSMPSFDSHASGFIEPGSMEGSQGHWLNESYMTSSVNGVTTTVHKRRDFEGNEHVTRTYADGRTVHTINGIEQASGPRGYLPQSPGVRHSSQPQRSDHRQMIQDSRNYISSVPQPATTQLPYNINNQGTDYTVHPPPSYPDLPSPGYTLSPPNHYDHHHHRVRRSSEKYPYPVDPSSGLDRHKDGHHKKRWWPGRV